ncbi:hypothetical protein BD626DRAFT_509667, partial [Schizophyllum amplum]
RKKNETATSRARWGRGPSSRRTGLKIAESRRYQRESPWRDASTGTQSGGGDAVPFAQHARHATMRCAPSRAPFPSTPPATSEPPRSTLPHTDYSDSQ